MIILIGTMIAGFVFMFSMLTKSQTQFKKYLDLHSEKNDIQLDEQRKVNMTFETAISGLQNLFSEWLELVKKESQQIRTNCHDHTAKLNQHTEEIEKVKGRVKKIEDKISA
jgi:hypothetical protein